MSSMLRQLMGKRQSRKDQQRQQQPPQSNKQQAPGPQAAPSRLARAARTPVIGNHPLRQTTSAETQPPSPSSQQPSQSRTAKDPHRIIACCLCEEQFPRHKMVGCRSKKKTHYLCQGCAKEYAQSVLGDGKFLITCCWTDCDAPLHKRELLATLDPLLIERWNTLVAQQYLAWAVTTGELPDTRRCPRCKLSVQVCYNAILFECPPPEQGGCGAVTCRRCRRPTHPERTCEEVVEKDAEGRELTNVDKARKELEVILSEALFQKCKKCNNPFIKEVGCNEMTCSPCGSKQCYQCGEAFDSHEAAHEHFLNPDITCQMYDNTAEFEQAKVAAAEAEGIEYLCKKYPGVKPSDLKFEVSDAVKELEEQRRQDWEHPETLLPEFFVEGEDIFGQPLLDTSQDQQIAAEFQRQEQEEFARMQQAFASQQLHGGFEGFGQPLAGHLMGRGHRL